MTERFASNFELKSTTDEGVFEGYASIFDEVDDGRDIIRRGAFSKTLMERAPEGIKLLWQHTPTEPIGTIEEMREDDRQPEDPITVFDVGPIHAPLVHGELMTERDVLEDELRSVLCGKAEQVDDQGDVGHARMIITND